jgi:cell division protein FtsB
MTNDNRSQQASLGCGSIILIALIVLFFSRQNNDELNQEIKGLQTEVVQLKQAVEVQTNQIKLLRESLK